MNYDDEIVREVIITRTVIECRRKNLDVMRNWTVTKHKFACEFSLRGPLVELIYDEEGRELGRNEVVSHESGLGPPSQAARVLAYEEGFDEEPTVVVGKEKA